MSVTPITQEFIPSPITYSNGNADPGTYNGLSEEEFKLLEEDDLNVISEFFVQADDTEDEDEVWARLGSTVCSFHIFVWGGSSSYVVCGSILVRRNETGKNFIKNTTKKFNGVMPRLVARRAIHDEHHKP